MGEINYRQFNDIISELNNIYGDYENFKKLEFSKKTYFKDQKELLEYILETILKESLFLEETTENSHIKYILLGSFYELLIKNCVLRFDYGNYIRNYYIHNDFEYTKNKLLKNLRKKTKDNQYCRLSNIFEYVQKQRNNFVHSPFKAMSYHVVDYQILESILVLNSLYKLEFSKDITKKIKKYLRKVKPNKFETNFKDVDFKNLYK